MFFYSHFCSQFLFTRLKMGNAINTKYLHMIRQLPQLHRFKLISQLFCFRFNCVCMCVLAVYTHVCATGRRLCLGPWGGWAMARSAGYRREGTLGFNTETSHTHSNTHKQSDQADTLLPSGSLSVNRCFLPSRPNCAASAPHWHTQCFPTGWPTGQVEGQTCPLVPL